MQKADKRKKAYEEEMPNFKINARSNLEAKGYLRLHMSRNDVHISDRESARSIMSNLYNKKSRVAQSMAFDQDQIYEYDNKILFGLGQVNKS